MPARIIFPEKGRVELQRFTPPGPEPDEVQVRTEYSLISIGTETTILHQRYDPDTHFARIFSFPQLKTGVQAVGRVILCGEDVSEFRTGDRVFMRMAHGSHQSLPARLVSAVPEGIDPKLACWCGLAKTAFRAAWAAEPLDDASILVVGAGPVGQMVLRWLNVRGAKHVSVVDLSSYRLELAEPSGAAQLLCGDLAEQIDIVREVNGGKGPTVVIDTTGNPKALTYAMKAAAHFGEIILLGDTGYPDRQHLSSEMMSKGLTIQATHDSHDRDGWTQRRIDEEFFKVVAQRRFELGGLITHEFVPEECAPAYALADNDRGNVMGILYDWSSTE
jgi:2-desacetyl-2-hydroxyethyl bacteriochlorophyllide A dehydrogenase